MPCFGSILDASSTCLLRAMRATKDGVSALDAMSNDSAITVSAPRCELVNRAFEGIEFMLVAIHGDLETAIVVVSANCTCAHHRPPQTDEMCHPCKPLMLATSMQLST